MKEEDITNFALRNSDYEIKEQDRFLPIANVARVMKKALPEHAKLSKESKECVQECVSEFISFISSQAADRCNIEKRKTINGEDILWAMYTLGFETYAETLKIYLVKYRQYEQIEANRKPQRRKTMLTESNTMAELYGSGSEEISPGNTSRASSSADPTFERFDYDLGGENIQGNSPLNYLEMPLVKNIDSYITSSPNEPNSDKS